VLRYVIIDAVPRCRGEGGPLHTRPRAGDRIDSYNGGDEENLMRKLVTLGLMMAMAVGATALAGEKRTRPDFATGTFVSAKLADKAIAWEFDLGGDAGKKTYEMGAAVKVQYAEKDGAKEATGIRLADGRDFRAKDGTTIVKGAFVSATLKDEKVVVTITPEGEKAEPLTVTLPAKLRIVSRKDAEGKVKVLGIGLPRTK